MKRIREGKEDSTYSYYSFFYTFFPPPLLSYLSSFLLFFSFFPFLSFFFSLYPSSLPLFSFLPSLLSFSIFPLPFLLSLFSLCLFLSSFMKIQSERFCFHSLSFSKNEFIFNIITYVSTSDLGPNANCQRNTIKKIVIASNFNLTPQYVIFVI